MSGEQVTAFVYCGLCGRHYRTTWRYDLDQAPTLTALKKNFPLGDRSLIRRSEMDSEGRTTLISIACPEHGELGPLAKAVEAAEEAKRTKSTVKVRLYPTAVQ